MTKNPPPRYYLCIYETTNITQLKKILFDFEIQPRHAVLSSQGKIIISYQKGYASNRIFYIGELTPDGKIKKEFDFHSIETIGLNDFRPWHAYYLAIDDNDNLFGIDVGGGRVFLLDSQWNAGQILLQPKRNNESSLHELGFPNRLCFIPEKKQLIVAHGNSCFEEIKNDDDQTVDKKLHYIAAVSIFGLSTSDNESIIDHQPE